MRNGKANYFAKGRLKPGEMNATESRYAAELERQKREGLIKWYRFECVKLKIATPKCWYCPDFLVLRADDVLELHEVKGALAVFSDDAKVKVKVTATEYPFALRVVYPRRGGGWKVEEY